MERHCESQRGFTHRRRWKEAASQLRGCSKNRLQSPVLHQVWTRPGLLAMQDQRCSALCSPISQALCCSCHGINFSKQLSVKPRGFGEDVCIGVHVEKIRRTQSSQHCWNLTFWNPLYFVFVTANLSLLEISECCFNRGFLLHLVQLSLSTVVWDKSTLEIKVVQLHFPSSPEDHEQNYADHRNLI